MQKCSTLTLFTYFKVYTVLLYYSQVIQGTIKDAPQNFLNQSQIMEILFNQRTG